MSRRILITGSREWPDRSRIWAALDSQLEFGPLTVVEGGADGADYYSNQWAWRNQDRGVTLDQHKADWDRPCDSRCYHKPRWRKDGSNYCPMAGHYRNQKMVDLGALLCLAFPLKGSRGTADCMKRAKSAGIEVLNYGWGGRMCCSSIEFHTNPHQGCILR